jgi:hypothetical protein
MAVALATLPLKSLADGEGDACLTASAVTGLDGDFAGAGLTAAALGAALAGATGLTTDFVADRGGAGVFFAATFGTGLAGVFLTAAFFTATFFTAIFLTADFFAAGFLVEAFCTIFRVAGFLTAGLPADFFAGPAFFAGNLPAALPAGLAAFLAAAGFAATFFAAGFAAARVGFAGVLLALFTVGPLVAAAFGLPFLTSFALAEDFPFCALAAVELRVIFAISLHQFSAVAAGCYSRRVLHRQAYFWNNRSTTHRRLFRQRECCESFDPIAASFV